MLPTEGREYDNKGDLHEWWQDKTIKKFKEKMKCFEKQYSTFQIGKDHVSDHSEIGFGVFKKNLVIPSGERSTDTGRECGRQRWFDISVQGELG